MSRTFGMWVFLASEILLFGTLLLLYQIFYYQYEPSFKLGSQELHFLHGTVNTIVLLTSSYFVALAEEKKEKRWLVYAMILGLLFLGIKAYEYYDLTLHGKFPLSYGNIPQEKKLFLSFYAYLTFLHVIHVIIGILALAMVWIGLTRRYKVHSLQENVGLYWHFVDVVWVFLYPLFYLVGHS